MTPVFICSIIFQLYVVHGTQKSNSRFSENNNIKVDDDFYLEIHKAIKDFKPVAVKHINSNVTDKDLKLDDHVAKNIMETHLYPGPKNKFSIVLKKYKDYAIKKGIEDIMSLRKNIAWELHVKEDKLPLISVSTIEKFIENSYKYLDQATNTKCKTNIDAEIMLLNLVHGFNAHLYNERIKIFNDMIGQANIKLSKDVVIVIIEHFQEDLNRNKQEDMEYLCLKQNICKPSLAFTDYIADVLHAILKLSDVKLADLFLKLSIPIKDHTEFFKLILGESAALKIGMKLENWLYRPDLGTRKILLALRSYLAKKYVFVKKVDEQANMRNKALRILVDIIDKSFDVTGDEVLALHFDLLLKTIVDWSVGRNNDIQKVLKSFVDQAVEIMKTNLSEEAMLEIRALVDILMRKDDKTNKIYRYLLSDGSKFVRDEDVSLKLAMYL